MGFAKDQGLVKQEKQMKNKYKYQTTVWNESLCLFMQKYTLRYLLIL